MLALRALCRFQSQHVVTRDIGELPAHETGQRGCVPGQANAPSHLVGNVSIDDFGRAGPATVRLADQVLAPAGIVPLIADLPAGVEATIRESKDRRLLFILNTLGEPADVPNIPKGTDLLGDTQVKAGRMRLPAYGCSIIELA